MKTKIMNTIKLTAAVLFLTLTSMSLSAQEANVGRTYVFADWQFNSPVSSDFVSQASGWGGSVDFQYFLTPKLSAGGFMAWHTNNEYIPRQTYHVDEGEDINTDTENSLFQLPFGLSGRYMFLDGDIVPYAGLKLGANYSEQTAYTDVITLMDDNWGFFVSPEIGLTFYPIPNHNFGLSVAAYYNYSTNKSDALNISGLNNFGGRIGIVVKL